MQKDNLIYMRHMLDMAHDAMELVQDKKWEDFEGDRVLQLALTHLIQNIGEAARRVSRENRNYHPEIPWPKIVGMRHKIVHDYIHVNKKVVWDTVTDDIPALIEILEAIVPPEQ